MFFRHIHAQKITSQNPITHKYLRRAHFYEIFGHLGTKPFDFQPFLHFWRRRSLFLILIILYILSKFSLSSSAAQPLLLAFPVPLARQAL